MPPLLPTNEAAPSASQSALLPVENQSSMRPLTATAPFLPAGPAAVLLPTTTTQTTVLPMGDDNSVMHPYAAPVSLFAGPAAIAHAALLPASDDNSAMHPFAAPVPLFAGPAAVPMLLPTTTTTPAPWLTPGLCGLRPSAVSVTPAARPAADVTLAALPSAATTVPPAPHQTLYPVPPALARYPMATPAAYLLDAAMPSLPVPRVMPMALLPVPSVVPVGGAPLPGHITGLPPRTTGFSQVRSSKDHVDKVGEEEELEKCDDDFEESDDEEFEEFEFAEEVLADEGRADQRAEAAERQLSQLTQQLEGLDGGDVVDALDPSERAYVVDGPFPSFTLPSSISSMVPQSKHSDQWRRPAPSPRAACASHAGMLA